MRVLPKAINSVISVQCDALLLNNGAISNTYPTMKIENNQTEITHEAKVGRLGEAELFFLESRGLSNDQAKRMIINGFSEPVIKSLPLEYAVELNRLIELEIQDDDS